MRLGTPARRVRAKARIRSPVSAVNLSSRGGPASSSAALVPSLISSHSPTIMVDNPLTAASSASGSPSASSLSRPGPARRTPSIPSPNDPLSAPSTSPSVSYPTYSFHKRKVSLSGSIPSVSAVSSHDSPVSGSPSPSSLPPTSPSSTPHLPPLVSRPSETSVPKGVPAGRPYARSVSEARQALLGQNLKAELQGLGVTSDASGAGMVQCLAGVGSAGDEWRNVKAAVESGKVSARCWE